MQKSSAQFQCIPQLKDNTVASTTICKRRPSCLSSVKGFLTFPSRHTSRTIQCLLPPCPTYTTCNESRSSTWDTSSVVTLVTKTRPDWQRCLHYRERYIHVYRLGQVSLLNDQNVLNPWCPLSGLYVCHGGSLEASLKSSDCSLTSRFYPFMWCQIPDQSYEPELHVGTASDKETLTLQLTGGTYSLPTTAGLMCTLYSCTSVHVAVT